MKLLRAIKKDNRGASLIAVVIAMVFVVSIGVLIMNITLSNISMKEMELSSKANFYSAENVLETIKSSLTDNATECMEQAYVSVLGKYSVSIKSANGVQSYFKASYMDELIEDYKVASETPQWLKIDDSSLLDFEPSIKYSDGSGYGYYAMGHYSVTKLTEDLNTSIADEVKKYLCVSDDDAVFEADYEAGTFTFKNVKIMYYDSRGYQTSIATDIVITTPKLNFDGTNTVEEFMKYSLIADNQIKMLASSEVDGNAYAGHGGISNEIGTSSFVGNTVVTRGTVSATNNSTLNIGSSVGVDATNLWAENVETVGDGSTATLNLTGNMYISDDLSLESTNSTVKLTGSYYGYHFQKYYTDEYDISLDTNPLAHPGDGYERDADYSSSIIVNGRNSKLDMTGLTNLFVAGRSYISKGNTELGNQDVMTGESVSLRTNQLEYNVPESYVSFNAAAIPAERPIFKLKEAENDKDSAIKFSNEWFLLTDAEQPVDTDHAKVYDYVYKDDPFNVYYFLENGVQVPRFYLKFKSVAHANKFFMDRYNALVARSEPEKHTLKNNMNKFLNSDDAIKISDTTYWTLGGTLMTINGDDPVIQCGTYNSDDWVVSGNYLGAFAQFADYTAQTYKSLQIDLTQNNPLVDSRSIRVFSDDVNETREMTAAIDKKKDPLFYNLIDEAVLATFLDGYSGRRYDNGATGSTEDTPRVVVIDNPDTAFPCDFNYGILVATGDVYVNSGFTGMILAGGTISVAGGRYSSDELMVSGLFEKDAALGLEATFTKVFPTYNSLSSDVIGVIKVEDYIGYNNWTKYAD